MISELEMILRVLAAAGLGAVVGFERERAHQPAGLRTHMVLVSGAALAMTLSINLSAGGWDPARLAAQVLTGVGFIGAGTILRFGPTVRGLTTAASLWTMSVVGLAVGAGYLFAAAAVTALLIIVLAIFNLIEARLIKPATIAHFTIYAIDRPGIEGQVHQILVENCQHIEGFHVDRHVRRQKIKVDTLVKLKRGETKGTVSARIGEIQGIRVVRYE